LLSLDSCLFDHPREIIVKLKEALIFFFFELDDEFKQFLNLVHVVDKTTSLLLESLLLLCILLLFHLGVILLEFLVHELQFFLKIFGKVFQKSINLGKFLVSAAELLEGIPFDDLVFKLDDESLTLLNLVVGVIDLLLEHSHLLDVSSVNDLLQEDVDSIDLLKVEVNVLEHIWHLVLEGIDELIFLVVSSVAVHLFTTVRDFLQALLSSEESFS